LFRGSMLRQSDRTNSAVLILTQFFNDSCYLFD
jgi:hypothetical protein